MIKTDFLSVLHNNRKTIDNLQNNLHFFNFSKVTFRSCASIRMWPAGIVGSGILAIRSFSSRSHCAWRSRRLRKIKQKEGVLGVYSFIRCKTNNNNNNNINNNRQTQTYYLGIVPRLWSSTSFSFFFLSASSDERDGDRFRFDLRTASLFNCMWLFGRSYTWEKEKNICIKAPVKIEPQLKRVLLKVPMN